MQNQPDDTPTLTEIIGGIASVAILAAIALYIL
jgi:hypothetical protein